MFRDTLQPKERPDLRAQVEVAFANRVREASLGENKSHDWQDPTVKQTYTQSDIDLGLRLNKIIHPSNGVSDEELVKLPFSPKSNEAYTDSLQDYHWLLRYAAEACFDYAGVPLNADLRRRLLKKDLAHEFEHALQGKGEQGLVIKYAVAFTEAPDGNSVTWRPEIVLTGHARGKVIRAIISATHWKSKGDEVALNSNSPTSN